MTPYRSTPTTLASLSADLVAIDALASTGFPARTGTETWSLRSLASGSPNSLTVTNPAGIAGNPTLTLAQDQLHTTGTPQLARLGLGRVAHASAVLARANMAAEVFRNAANSADLYGWRANADDELEALMTVVQGPWEAPTNPGPVSFADAAITSDSPVGTAHQIALRLGHRNFLRLYAESDGADDTQSRKIFVDEKIDVATAGVAGLTRYIICRVLPHDVYCAVATTIGGDFRLPFAGTIVDCGAYVDTAGEAGGPMVLDVRLNGTSIMTTTKIAIVTAQKSSEDGGATQPVLTTTAYAAHGIFTFDIVSGIHTTAAQGCSFWIQIRET